MIEVDVVELNRLSRRLREIALRASQHGGELPISASELAIVEYVARHPHCSIGEISQSTGLSQSQVSKRVRLLSDNGVFETGVHPGDRRVTTVRLALATRRQVFEEYGSRSIESTVATVVPTLSPEQAYRIVQLLEELAELLGTAPVVE
jgi:DNA-binding MarR family transcriptional regulator